MLCEQVHVARRFQRSIRIDTDLGEYEALEGFICSQSSADVLLSLSKHIENGQMAFTWTGPYGGGKSSLALVLAAILNGDTKLRKEAADLVGSTVAEALWGAMPLGNEGWTVLPVVGHRGSPVQAIGEALVTKGLVHEAPKSWSESDLIKEFKRLAGEKAAKEGGLLLILDEMGKFLEAASQDNVDIYIFQQIAEIAARSNGRIVVIGILHQAFEEYSQRLARVKRDEWAKIQGRYLDLLVNVTGDEHLELLSRAILSKTNLSEERITKVVSAEVRSRRTAAKSLPLLLESCWPLHPAVACLLGSISRRRFGQNQRSLFGFLSSAEPFGFQDFLHFPETENYYTPVLLWEYLKSNLEPAILASPDGHRWSMAIEVIERCEALETTKLHIDLLKVIALVDLFKERTGLAASPQLLSVSVPGATKSDVEKALKELVTWSFIIFRKHIDAYAIFAGSDFDIEQAISDSLASTPEINFKQLTSLAGLHPILAKRHYHETGALRWFDIEILPLSHVQVNAIKPLPNEGTIGRFILAVPTEGESSDDVLSLCQSIVDEASIPIIIGFSSHSTEMIQIAREFLTITIIKDESSELAGDSVARREVLARISELRVRLEASLLKMFGEATWIEKGRSRQRLTYAELSSLTSRIADSVLSKSPRITNELLNRVKPSSNAVAAQKALLKKMVSFEGLERLGIEGFPAEGGLFDSIINYSGLYKQDAAGRWHFSQPESEQDRANLYPVWRAALDYLKDNSNSMVSIEDLYAIWRRKPYGVKDGLLPVIAVTFILANRSHLASYRERIFQSKFTDLDIDYLSVDPSSIQIRWMELPESSLQLLHGLASIVISYVPDAPIGNFEPINVGRGLVGIFESLAPWVKRTSRLSKNAILVRDLLKKASDPNRLIFDDIPKIFSKKQNDQASSMLTSISEGIGELVAAYSDMLARLQELLLDELDVPNDSVQSLNELRERASNVEQVSGNQLLNSFVSRLKNFYGELADIEGLASLVIGKPPREWIDSDIDHARLELASTAQQFLRIESFARVKGRPDKRHSISLVVGLDGRPRPVTGEFAISQKEVSQVEAVINTLQNTLLSSDLASKNNIILAALAELSARYLQANDQTMNSPVSEA